MTKSEKEAYLLIYKRFNHLRLKKIRNLYKVITLSKSIKVLKSLRIYKVYTTTKMINLVLKELSQYK